MTPFKFTTIAHADHSFCSPLSGAKVDQLLGLLPLQAGDRVLDVGCGKAEMLLRLVERFGVSAVGLDLSPTFLESARTRATGRIPSGALCLRQEAALEFADDDPGDFAAALCVGSTHAYGTWEECLRVLLSQVRCGGHLLLGHGYWKCAPHPEYLAGLGATAGDYTDHAGNVALAEAMGLVPLYSTTSSDDEWDEYEGLYCRAVERYVRDHPEDPDAPSMTDRIRSWRRLYHRWGRTTLGFGMYLLQKH